ncbi:Copper transporter [Caenorhabditis elegans]|uniref:Copper transporter n=1 Tax=Caenorhabditis elegans TaxID=6239 RepID=H2L0G1_CAEEL|nr:Copper transporter [Caenorhabditis elegans]CCD72947.1 Copper transporter [Caenorhabditis elegans]|eukprot:NP_001248981.1 Uncharacterized protein CELE_K12C11.3 [Caenorhabditis elegans]
MSLNTSTMAPMGKTTKMWQWYHVELNDVILFENWKVQDMTSLYMPLSMPRTNNRLFFLRISALNRSIMFI